MELQPDGSEYVLKTYSPQETEKVGSVLGSQLVPGDVVALVGELGSGKTCFTRGLAKGLGIERTVPIVSPSFTIINEYPGVPPLYHLDFYRIDTIAQVFDLGYEEYFYGEGVTVIEWGDKADRVLPEEHFLVEFFFEDEDVRKIRFRGPGKRCCSLIRNLKATIGPDPKGSIPNNRN